MEKRTFKLNILDIVIFIVVICSVAVLVFRDTITELFEETTVVTLEVAVNLNGEGNVDKALGALSKSVIFEPEANNKTAFKVNVIDVQVISEFNEKPNEAKLTFVCMGYERFGRYYTKSGERIYINTECAFMIDGERVVGEVVSIDEKASS